MDHNKLWKILKEMGIPDHLTCLLRNLHACHEATVRNVHETTKCLQIGKGVHQGWILSLFLVPCNKYCIFFHYNRMSIDWLGSISVKAFLANGPKFRLGNVFTMYCYCVHVGGNWVKIQISPLVTDVCKLLQVYF